MGRGPQQPAPVMSRVQAPINVQPPVVKEEDNEENEALMEEMMMKELMGRSSGNVEADTKLVESAQQQV